MFFQKSNRSYFPTDNDKQNITLGVPPTFTYSLDFNPKIGFYLNRIDSFENPLKLYGKTLSQAERILNTFFDRPSITGALFTGEKGSGKSLLARTISIEGAKKSVPTIVVNAAYKGDAFNSFVQDLAQPAIFLFDEFEKVYKEDDQEHILTLLDGMYPSKKLFVFTCNNRFKINTNMKNRPGRIFYLIKFSGLDLDFVEEYAKDNLKNLENLNQLIEVVSLFEEFNFDMLKALVEEMNRYNEDPRQAIRMLNIIPSAIKKSHSVKVLKDGADITEMTNYQNKCDYWPGNPLKETIHIYLKNKTRDDGDIFNLNALRLTYVFQPSHLKNVDIREGKYTYECRLVLILCI